MAQTETQVNAAEIERVRPKVPTLFDRDDMFFATIQKGSDVEKVSKRDMRVPLEIRPGGQFGHFNPAGGSLGRGDGPTFEKALIPQAFFKFGVEYQRSAEWGTDDARKAVINSVRHNLAVSLDEFRRNLDSMCMTDGTGAIGTVSAVSTGGGTDTITLGTDGFGARLMRFGQPFCLYDATFATQRVTTAAGGTETAVTFLDLPTKTVKSLAWTGITATDRIVAAGLSGANPVSLLGVPYHHNSASTGTWLGLDRATVPEIRGNRVTATGALALPYARLAMNRMSDRIGLNDIPKCTAWMHPCQAQAYEELAQMISIINKDSAGKDVDLYFGDNMQLAGAKVRTSNSWDKTRIDFVVPDAWGRAEMLPCDFYEVDGRKIFEIRGSDGGVATANIFYYVYGWNLYMNNPVKGAYISNLTVPTGY